DKTALYDEDNLFNSDKVNYYIYQSFLGNIETPTDAVQDYVSLVDLVECIDFQRVEFEKQISLSTTRKVEIKTRWNVKKIGKICQTSSGGTPLSTVLKYYENGNIPWINSGEVKQGIITQTENFITQLGLENSSAKLFPINTVLVAMYGATAGQVGILGIEATTNQAVCGILPNNEFIPKFLFFYLREQTDRLLDLRTGKARLNLSQDVIKNFPIPLPPKEVQEQIIQEIEVLENREQELRDNIENYQNQMKVKVDEIYTSNSSRKPIGNLCLNVQYGISQQMNTEDKGYKIFRMNEIIEGKMFDSGEMKYVDISPEEFDKFKLAPGDILFNRTNSIELVGKTGIFTLEGNYCFASYLVRLKIDTNQANPFFVNFIMNSNQFQQVAKEQATKSINQANINATKLKSIEIPVPSLSIQNKIATEIQNIEAEIYNLETELNIIPEQKEAILQKYL
ncbi:MAG: restriction endonuclease subunit S, partial [Dolichospermum sp.]